MTSQLGVVDKRFYLQVLKLAGLPRGGQEVNTALYLVNQQVGFEPGSIVHLAICHCGNLTCTVFTQVSTHHHVSAHLPYLMILWFTCIY